VKVGGLQTIGVLKGLRGDVLRGVSYRSHKWLEGRFKEGLF
jgi:hypothetical protein